MTTTKQKLMTADELLRLPRGEGRRYELIRGVLIEKMPTGDPHGDTVTRTSSMIFTYADDNDYGVVRSGEPGYRLERGPDTVRAPDCGLDCAGPHPAGYAGLPGTGPGIWRWRSNLLATPTRKWRPRLKCGSATARKLRWCLIRIQLQSEFTNPTASRSLLARTMFLTWTVCCPDSRLPFGDSFAGSADVGRLDMTTTVMKLITADELLAMPRGYGYRYELIRGAVIPSPASLEAGCGGYHLRCLSIIFIRGRLWHPLSYYSCTGRHT